MAENSYPWSGTTVGDAGPYTDIQWQQSWKSITKDQFSPPDFAGMTGYPESDSGVLVDISGLPSNQIRVSAFKSYIHGLYYENTTAQIFIITPPLLGSRTDTILLNKDFTTQTARMLLTTGISPLVQVDGVIWQEELVRFDIDAAGTISNIQYQDGFYLNTRVKTDMIDDEAVTTPKIADEAITEPKYALYSISGIKGTEFPQSHIQPFSVGFTDIAFKSLNGQMMTASPTNRGAGIRLYSIQSDATNNWHTPDALNPGVISSPITGASILVGSNKVTVNSGSYTGSTTVDFSGGGGGFKDAIFDGRRYIVYANIEWQAGMSTGSNGPTVHIEYDITGATFTVHVVRQNAGTTLPSYIYTVNWLALGALGPGSFDADG